MRIALFVTCLADTLFPEAAKATVRLLERHHHHPRQVGGGERRGARLAAAVRRPAGRSRLTPWPACRSLPVESDRAELIVQLGRDRPSHILVPAIHRNRAEIRKIFRRPRWTRSTPGPPDLARRLRAARTGGRQRLGVGLAGGPAADQGADRLSS
jgi:hypothetical protein